MRITRLIGVISGNGVLLAKLFGAIGLFVRFHSKCDLADPARFVLNAVNAAGLEKGQLRELEDATVETVMVLNF
jgi:hypothetical protein